MELGALGLPRKLAIWNTDTPFLTRTPPAIISSGVLNIGDGVFDGISSGKLAGNALGTFLVINTASGFSGDLFNFSAGGNRKLSLGSGGMLTGTNYQFFGSFAGVYGTSYSNLTANGMFNILGASTGSGSVDGTAGSFVGTSAGTMFGINATSTFVGDLFNLQASGVSKLKADVSGNLVSAGQVNDATGIGSIARLDAYRWYS